MRAVSRRAECHVPAVRIRSRIAYVSDDMVVMQALVAAEWG